jgi:hypothetical protein
MKTELAGCRREARRSRARARTIRWSGCIVDFGMLHRRRRGAARARRGMCTGQNDPCRALVVRAGVDDQRSSPALRALLRPSRSRRLRIRVGGRRSSCVICSGRDGNPRTLAEYDVVGGDCVSATVGDALDRGLEVQPNDRPCRSRHRRGGDGGPRRRDSARSAGRRRRVDLWTSLARRARDGALAIPRGPAAGAARGSPAPSSSPGAEGSTTARRAPRSAR